MRHDSLSRALAARLHTTSASESTSASDATQLTWRAARSQHRRALLRAGALAGAALLVTGVAGAAALSTRDDQATALPSLSPTTSPSPGTSASPTVPTGESPLPTTSEEPERQVATIPPVTSADPLSTYALPQCGDPAPTPHTSEGGVALDDVLPTSALQGTEFQSINFKVANLGDSPFWSALTHDPLVIFARDGQVVGWKYAGVSPEFNWRYTSNGPTFTSFLEEGGYDCAAESDGDADRIGLGALPVGDVDAYLVVRTWANAETAAIGDLSDKGFNGRLADSPVYVPGSWDCELWMDPSFAVLPCLSGVLPSVKYNPDTGSVNATFDPMYLRQEFDITLISEPIPMRLTDQQLGLSAAEVTLAPPARTDEAFTCGYTFSEPLEASIQLTHTSDDTGVVNNVNSQAEVFAESAYGEATVTYPGSARLWFVDSGEIDAGVRALWASTVVGSAVLTVNGGEPIPFVRYNGPTAVDIEVSDIDMCPGYEEPDQDEYFYAWAYGQITVDDAEDARKDQNAYWFYRAPLEVTELVNP